MYLPDVVTVERGNGLSAFGENIALDKDLGAVSRVDPGA